MQFYEEFDEFESKFLVCEFCPEGSLEKFLEKEENKDLEIKDALKIFFEIASGLKYLHDLGIAHRDMKEDNIIFKDGIAKICDFGFANNSETMVSNVGTPLYMAPELVKQSNLSYNNKVDVWAIGVILYKLLFGTYYFYQEMRKKLFKQIEKSKFKITAQKKNKIGPELDDLLTKMFQKDQKNRIDINEVLNHPALKETKKDYLPLIKRIEENMAKPEILSEVKKFTLDYGDYQEKEVFDNIIEEEEEFYSDESIFEEQPWTEEYDWIKFMKIFDNLEEIYLEVKNNGNF